jgi:hypothetical protein
VREFGGYDSVFIRTAIHATRDIFNTSSDDLNLSYEHNCLAVMYALQAVLPPLIEGGRPGGGADQCHRGKTLDGYNMYTTGNFFPVAGGFNNAGM